jgi:O-antigen ligase
MALLKKLTYLLLILFPLLELARVNLIRSVSVSLNDLLVIVIFLVFLALVCLKKIKIKGKLLFQIIGFFIVCFVSLLVNVFNFSIIHILVSSLYLFRWIAYSALYLTISNQSIAVKKTISKILLFVGSIILLLGFLQYIFYQDLGNLYYLGWDKHLYRLFGTFLDPNFAGIFFSIFTVFVLGYLLEEKDTKKKVFYSILSLLSVVAVVFTYSRTALFSLIVSILVFLVMSKKIKNFLIFIPFLILIIVSSPKIFQTEGTNLFRSVSSIERLKSIERAGKIFVGNPVLGVGFDTYRYAQYKYGFISGAKWETSHSGSGADNSYLFILATTGIIGFITYAALIRKIFLVTSRDRRWKIVALSSLIGLLTSALFINSLFYPPLMLWFWVLLGITESS